MHANILQFNVQQTTLHIFHIIINTFFLTGKKKHLGKLQERRDGNFIARKHKRDNI